MRIPLNFFTLTLLLFTSGAVSGLEPKEIIIIANENWKESKEVAQYYAEKRKVPVENIISFSLPKTEDITRAEYERLLRDPLRQKLKERRKEIKCILLVYGVPLRVGAKVPTATEKEKIKLIEEQLKQATSEKQKQSLNAQLLVLNGDQSVASVDSELMLLWWNDVEPTRWIINPAYWALPASEKKETAEVLCTCRLDGPTSAIARRLVDDALAAESKGLKGKAYIDARGIKFNKEKPGETGTGYEGYDESYRELAALLKKAGLEVILDDKQALFEAKSCPEAVLYSGWYSHAKFIDSCQFQQGAIAWHLASSEARSLRREDVGYWCPNLLKKGVAATLGPVAEPYTVGFPKPAEFYGFLLTGKYTVAEVFQRTLILTSWQMTLIADPLYNPFKHKPLLQEKDVVLSPAGAKMFP